MSTHITPDTLRLMPNMLEDRFLEAHLKDSFLPDQQVPPQVWEDEDPRNWPTLASDTERIERETLLNNG